MLQCAKTGAGCSSGADSEWKNSKENKRDHSKQRIPSLRGGSETCEKVLATLEEDASVRVLNLSRAIVDAVECDLVCMM